MKIDVRSKGCLYVEIDGYTFYIDCHIDGNGKPEQIMSCWKRCHDEHGSYALDVKTNERQYDAPYMQESWQKSQKTGTNPY